MSRTITTAILLFAATTGVAAKPTVYRCVSSGLAEITLNLSDHRFGMAGAVGPLDEGLWFNFTTPLGYYLEFDLGDPDKLRLERAATIEGTVVVSRSKDRMPSGSLVRPSPRAARTHLSIA